MKFRVIYRKEGDEVGMLPDEVGFFLCEDGRVGILYEDNTYRFVEKPEIYELVFLPEEEGEEEEEW